MYENVQRANTMTIISSFSAAASLTVVVSTVIFRKEMKARPSMIIMFYILLSNFLTSIGSAVGAVGSQKCMFEGIITNWFTLSSSMWTLISVVLLYRLLTFRKAIVISWPMHAFCWGIPALCTFLPLVDGNYGYNYAVEGGWCRIQSNWSGWVWLSFDIWIWLSFAVILVLSTMIYGQLQKKLPPEIAAASINCFYNLYGYPLLLFVCLALYTGCDLYEHYHPNAENSTRPFMSAAIFLRCLMGLLVSIYYWLTNPFTRTLWVGFYKRYQIMRQRNKAPKAAGDRDQVGAAGGGAAEHKSKNDNGHGGLSQFVYSMESFGNRVCLYDQGKILVIEKAKKDEYKREAYKRVEDAVAAGLLVLNNKGGGRSSVVGTQANPFVLSFKTKPGVAAAAAGGGRADPQTAAGGDVNKPPIIPSVALHHNYGPSSIWDAISRRGSVANVDLRRFSAHNAVNGLLPGDVMRMLQQAPPKVVSSRRNSQSLSSIHSFRSSAAAAGGGGKSGGASTASHQDHHQQDVLISNAAVMASSALDQEIPAYQYRFSHSNSRAGSRPGSRPGSTRLAAGEFSIHQHQHQHQPSSDKYKMGIGGAVAVEPSSEGSSSLPSKQTQETSSDRYHPGPGLDIHAANIKNEHIVNNNNSDTAAPTNANGLSSSWTAGAGSVSQGTSASGNATARPGSAEPPENNSNYNNNNYNNNAGSASTDEEEKMQAQMQTHIKPEADTNTQQPSSAGGIASRFLKLRPSSFMLGATGRVLPLILESDPSMAHAPSMDRLMLRPLSEDQKSSISAIPAAAPSDDHLRRCLDDAILNVNRADDDASSQSATLDSNDPVSVGAAPVQ